MKIGCVLVMYNPRQELLTTSLNSLNGQVDEIFLGDNSVNTPDFMATLLALYPHVYYHGFNENLGIAEAQNRGITYFQEKGFDFVCSKKNLRCQVCLSLVCDLKYIVLISLVKLAKNVMNLTITLSTTLKILVIILNFVFCWV